MVVLASVIGPFMLAALAGVILLGTAQRWDLLVGAGLLGGLGFLLYAYLSAPAEAEYLRGCPRCGNYLGRWWEPGLVALLIGAGYATWILGLFVGAAIRSRAIDSDAGLSRRLRRAA